MYYLFSINLWNNLWTILYTFLKPILQKSPLLSGYSYYKATWWLLKVILHQFWVKKIFPWKFNLEYSGTFTKRFMHVSSWNMFPTTRNLQICVHVYRPRHYCADWLTFGCFVPMIADHILVKKSFGPMIADHDLVKKR